MKTKDPTNELLKAYVKILKGSVVYNGSVITVGTRIPRGVGEYVLVYIDDLTPMDTGDSVIFEAIMALQIVSQQESTEGDETVVNSIFEQVIELVGDPEAFSLSGFRCATSQFYNTERLPELSDTNYTITRKLQMSNIIEQIT